MIVSDVGSCTASRTKQSLTSWVCVAETNAEIPRNSELLLALYAFDKAATDNGNGSTLLHATLRTLRVISRVLEPALGHPTAKTANYVIFSALGTALYHVIRGSLPSIGIRQGMMTVLDFQLSDVNKIFDCLIENIFRPIIRAFRRITQAFISDLLGDPPRTNDISENRGTEKSPQHPPVIDCRPDLLRLFQTLVESLCLASSVHNPVHRSDNQDPSPNSRWAVSLSSLKASLILEVVHELERNLFTAPCDAGSGAKGPDTEPDYGRSDESRVLDSTVPDSANLHTSMKRLVAKDTLWYLCSLMHILADLPIPEGLKSPSGAMSVAGSSAAPTPSLEAEITTHGDGTLLLELLHDAILSALYNLVLKCQPTINQPQKDQDRTLDKRSHYPTREPIADDRYTLSTIRSADDHDPKATSDSQPMIGRDKVGALKAGVTLTNGAGGPVEDSQAQGQSLTVNDTESEVGDPSGPNLRALLDSHGPPTLTGGAHCDTDHQSRDVANQGESCEVIGLGHRALSENTPELEVYSSDAAGAATECLIDEAGFTMLLGVVERYILDPEYIR